MSNVDERLMLKSDETYVDSQLMQNASIGYVDRKTSAAIAAVVDTATLVLDALRELAAALNNDSNYVGSSPAGLEPSAAI